MILYELLTGRTPFRGSGLAVAGQVLTQEPLPLSEHRADVDPRLEVICRKAMAKKSAERYISMSALARALTDFLQAPADVGSSDSIEGPIAARTEASPSRVDPASQVDSHPEGGEPEGESIWPRGRNRLIVASAGLVALALVGYVVYSRTHPGSGFSVKSPDGDEASRTANLSGGSSSARSESAGINSDRIAWTNGEGEWSIRADELTVRYPGSGRRQAFLWFGKPSGPAVFSFQVMHDRPGGWVSAQMRMRGAASDFLQLAFGGVNPSLSFQNWTNGKREGRPNNNPDDIQPGFALTPGRW